MEKIYKFTYTDYIIYQQIIKTKTELKDINESYHYDQNKIKHYHDKIFKELFTNKRETALFINKYLGLKGTKNEIKEKDLQKCDTEYITKEKEKLESDILYKLKQKEIYFLIEHQSTVDFSMAERILEYCVEIIRKIKKERIINYQKEEMPGIYPIVLYTGKRKWTAKTELIQMQEEIYGIEKRLNCSYLLVDINKHTKEELIKERSSIAKAMLMEKVQNKKELLEILEKVVKEELTKEEKEFITDIITNIAREEIGEEKVKELEEKIIGKREESNMVMENLRRIIREDREEARQEGINQGINQAIKQVVKRMLKNNMKDETIKMMTEINDIELEKIKKEIKREYSTQVT